MGVRRRIKNKGVKGGAVNLLGRKTTVCFLFCLGLGLLAGSVVVIREGQWAELLYNIVTTEIEGVNSQNYLDLVITSGTGFMGFLVLIYLALNSRKGNSLVYIVPLCHGVVVGVTVTVLLNVSFSLMLYICMCVIIPKIIETYLLLILCSKTVNYCEEVYLGNSNGSFRGDYNSSGYGKNSKSLPPIFYIFLCGFYFLIDALLVFSFRYLYF